MKIWKGIAILLAVLMMASCGAKEVPEEKPEKTKKPKATPTAKAEETPSASAELPATPTAAATEAPAFEPMEPEGQYNGSYTYKYGEKIYAAILQGTDGGEYAPEMWDIVVLDERYELVETLVSGIEYRMRKIYQFDDKLLVSPEYIGTTAYFVSLATHEVTPAFNGVVIHVDYDFREIYYLDIGRVCAVSFDGGDPRVMAGEEYTFIDLIDGTLYFGSQSDDGVILSSMPVSGRRISKIAVIGYTDEFEYNWYEDIVAMELCGDRIIMMIGGYQGTGNYFYGDIVSIRMDGSGEIRKSGVEDSLVVIDDMIYLETSVEGGYGIYRTDAELSNLEPLFGDADAMGGNDDGLLFYVQYGAFDEEYLVDDMFSIYDTRRDRDVTGISTGAFPSFENYSHTLFSEVQDEGDYVHFRVRVYAYDEEVDSWRGHLAYDAAYLMKKDGEEVVPLFQCFYEEPLSIGS